MKNFRLAAFVAILAIGFSTTGDRVSHAGTFTKLVMQPTPVASQLSEILEVGHKKRRFKRRSNRRHNLRRHNRNKHHRRNRHNRQFYDHFLDIVPYLIQPNYSSPRNYNNRCEHWSNACHRNWGGGSDYIGCMRYYHCL